MKRKSLVAGCLGAMVLTTLVVLPAAAQGKLPDEKTFFTFSGPVELPGLTLPAGKYMFRLADSLSNRHIVQIFDADGSKIHATILAIPSERMTPTEEPKVDFMETAENAPPAIRKWWYPGDTIGHEFVYPKDQAMRLARATRTPVLMTEVSAANERGLRDAAVMTMDPSGEARERERAADAGQTVPRTDARASAGRAVGTSGQTSTEASNRPRRTLPRTASNLPLMGLVGLLSLAGALAVRMLTSQRA